MRPPRFSIAGLMGVVVAAAVGVAALRFANEWWAGALWLATLAGLGLAILGVVYRRGAKRAGWLGAAVFGGGYLALALAPWAATTTAPSLPTTMLLTTLYSRAFPNRTMTTDVWTNVLINTTTPPATGTPWGPMPTPANPPGYVVPGAGSPGVNWAVVAATVPTTPPEPFVRVGQCLWAWLAALVGAVAGRVFFATRGEPAPST